MRRNEGRVVDLVFKRVFRETSRALDRENLTRALKKGGPRSEWKERRDDERRWVNLHVQDSTVVLKRNVHYDRRSVVSRLYRKKPQQMLSSVVVFPD
ncbi:hypothetical protein TNCV_3479941 [Trichonephila clavipes]|nr:hypothetical protein TNCV_3479941 [Trichonephila clavipes]